MRAPALITAALALTGCEGEAERTAFEQVVAPVIERRCASPVCHGVSPGAEARGDHIDWEQLFFQVDASGHLTDIDQAQAAVRRHINTVEPEFSSLLRKPLGVGFGGRAHRGRANFVTPRDPEWRALRDWIATQTEGGEDPEPLGAMEALFASTVLPALVEGTCTEARCHGPDAGGTPYRLDPGYAGRFDVGSIRRNYEASLAQLSLDGDPSQSRLLRKSLPLGEGIVHKGTNFDFYAENPAGRAAITAWICAERRARTGADCLEPGEAPMRGFVFVAGPVSPRAPFDVDAFEPGRDLWLAVTPDDSLTPARLENLTEGLHPEGPVDIRDPAVSPDGSNVLFAMRRHPGEGHHLYVLDLESRRVEQLTEGNGPLPGGGIATDRDPAWGPDDAIWYVSTRAGTLSDDGRLLDADLYTLDPARRWTHTAQIERKPGFFTVGDEAGGEIGFTALRAAIPSQARAHSFRFPPDLSTDYHQHFGVTPPENLFYDTRELPDGRYVTVIGDLGDVWRAGRLGVVDRNLGPELGAGEAALEAYVAPLTRLELGAYRDPAPLPDGRVLVAHDPADPALDDPSARFTPRIEVLTLTESADGSGPVIDERRTLVSMPGVALTDPEPVTLRAPLHASAPHVPAAEPSGLLVHHGLPMIDALLENLPPAGDKSPRDDLRFVRLVEALPRTPDQRPPVPGVEGASSVALSPVGAARILAELPLAADGTFQARVPADVPFRIQGLDARRMAVGAVHNRWFEVAPGQKLVQGISVAAGIERYNVRCSACHGAPDGVGTERAPFPPPDALTGASLTLSRYDQQNPRRPLEAPVVGDETRIEIDFERDVQPILDRRCVRCHGGGSPPSLSGGETRWFTEAYESLLSADYIDRDRYTARGSFLVEKLTGEELEAPRALADPGTTHPADAPLTSDELLQLVRWIELGATFEATDAR